MSFTRSQCTAVPTTESTSSQVPTGWHRIAKKREAQSDCTPVKPDLIDIDGHIFKIFCDVQQAATDELVNILMTNPNAKYEDVPHHLRIYEVDYQVDCD